MARSRVGSEVSAFVWNGSEPPTLADGTHRSFLAAGDEVTVKRLKRRGREIVLLPENSEFAPIVVNVADTDLSIEGVAVGLLRTGAFK